MIPGSLTTLQLASVLVNAVLTAQESDAIVWHRIDRDLSEQAVLQTLRANGAWFCRMSRDARGVTVAVQMPLFEENDK